MRANDAIREMLSAAGLSQAEAGRRLGISRSNVNSDVMGHSTPGAPHGMRLDRLLNYAGMCGYSLMLVPSEAARPPLCVDGVNSGSRRRTAAGGEGRQQ